MSAATTDRQAMARAAVFLAFEPSPAFMQRVIRWLTDFCQLTLGELIAMTNDVIRQDRVNPQLYRPIVAIGHTYELTDPNTVDQFLLFLKTERIEVVTFKAMYSKLVRGHGWSTSLSYAT